MYPLPEKEMRAIIAKYPKASIKWVQEEPQNMGAWQYLLRYFRKDPIDVVSRKEAASPATGFKKVHDDQQARIVKEAFE